MNIHATVRRMQEASTREQPRSLRDAQRAFTRARICSAARELFFLRGYEATTVEDIATATGASRSTFYTHFRDKEEILTVIADEYTIALCEVATRLAGPRPSRAVIDAWLLEVAAFISRERTPTVLIVALANGEQEPAAILRSGELLIDALAIQLPAFARVQEERGDPGLATAWSTVVLRELGQACLQYSRDPGRPGVQELLVVASELLHRFVHEKHRRI
jgi:AcrR family transcriptional regulator